MSTIIKPKRATQEEVAASTKVLSKDEILLATPNGGSPSGKLKLYRGDGVTPANELPVGIDGELGDDLRISAFDESNAEGNAEIEAGASLSRLFGNIRRKFAQVQSEADDKVNSSNGDISNTVIGSVDAIEDNFPEPAAGESVKTYFGKVKKFIADFNSFKNGIITLGRLANNAETTVEGFALDARMGKTLGDRVAQLNSDLGEVSLDLAVSINGKSLIATILPTLNDIGKTCFGRFQSPTDFTPKYPGYSYGFTVQRIHSDVISLQCHPAYTDDTEFYEYEISKSQWSYKGNLITNTDLMNSEPLDLTYINNKYVSIESFNRVRSAKITPTLAILSLNLAVENCPHNDEFINIGKINGATVLITTLANVPVQNGKGVLTYQIDSNGNIAIYNGASETINSFCRVMIPLVGRF